MDRIEEFTQDGKKIVYIDFSHFTTTEELSSFIESAKPYIKKYPLNSIYTITNMEGMTVNSETHDIMAGWVEHNKPYVKFGAVYGVDGIKRILAKTIAVLTKRNNLVYVSSRGEALNSLLQQD